MTPELADFRGTWRISRRVVAANGPNARFSGLAEFTTDASGLVCDEAGELRLDGQAPFRAERRYLWRPGAAGTIEVQFADGRPFHWFDPGTGTPCARHDCAPDVYEVRYDFRRWPVWSSRWRVRGPRKDYAMVTICRR